MTDKKLCGLRSVPSLFRLFANGVHAAPQKGEETTKRLHFSSAELLAASLGRQMLARSARSLLARSSRSARLPPPFARSARSRQRLCLPWLRSARPPSRRSTSASQFRSLRSFVLRFTPKREAVFSRKKSVQGNAHFSRKWNIWFFLRIHSEKT